MWKKIETLYTKALEEGIGWEEALFLTKLEGERVMDLIFFANKIRQEKKSCIIRLCSIVNAKSGDCSQDCIFCAQSRYHKTNIQRYSLMEEERVLEVAHSAKKAGARRFGIVTSGQRISRREVLKVAQAIRRVKEEVGIRVCASLGMLDEEELLILKDAGLSRYNHNLEASPTFFPRICTTHSFWDRYRCAKAVKELGLQLCCGGIFGLGEGWEQRVELAFLLKKIGADAVPINIIHPIKGTKCEGIKPPAPLQILKIVAIFRFIYPDADIAVCGGREHNLKELQPFMYTAGANAIIIGDYLTTKGRPPQEDIQLIKSLGLVPEDEVFS
jgi:biotin synthase